MPPRFKVRAVTIHVERGVDAEKVEDLAYRAREAVDAAVSEHGVEVWSLRITLPSFERLAEAVDAAKSLEGLVSDEKVFINLGSYSPREEEFDVFADLMEAGFFASLGYKGGGWEEARRYSSLLHRLSDRSPDLAVHVGFNPLGGEALTPYYPLSTSPGNSRIVTVALLYPNMLLDAYRRGGLDGMRDAAVSVGEKALNLARAIVGSVEASSVGIDVSVSPWMEESSLGLVEYIAGVRLPEPGFAHGVGQVNRVLAEVASSLGLSVGFNEVQLPVAEDLKLKARVSELNTTARDLLRLSGVCLAGLDMVVVPASIDGVAGLLLDAVAYSQAKSRIVGVRVIPVEGVEPGDEIFLSRFGETPVIPI